MRYWPWGKGGWIVAKFFFSVFMDRDEMEVTKNAKEEQGWCPANSWPNKLGKWRIYYMAKEICHLVRIKTCLFQETWKKANCVFSKVNPRESFLFSLFADCLLLLFATLWLILSKNYKLCMSAPSKFFYCMWSKGTIPSRQNGPILLTWVANQNTGFDWCCPRALPAI